MSIFKTETVVDRETGELTFKKSIFQKLSDSYNKGTDEITFFRSGNNLNSSEVVKLRSTTKALNITKGVISAGLGLTIGTNALTVGCVYVVSDILQELALSKYSPEMNKYFLSKINSKENK